MIKAVFWDNDGVLVDSEQWFYEASREVLAREGIVLTEKDFFKISLIQGGSTLSLLLGKGYSKEDISKFREIRNRRYDEMLLHNDITVEHGREVLEKLSNKYRMVIVTGSCRHHFDTQHKKTGYTRFFEKIFSAGDYERQKPFPDSYLKALTELSLSPKEVVVIEDSPRGVEAAKAAGLRVIAVKRGFAKHFDHSNADFIVDSLDLIPSIIENIQ